MIQLINKREAEDWSLWYIVQATLNKPEFPSPVQIHYGTNRTRCSGTSLCLTSKTQRWKTCSGLSESISLPRHHLPHSLAI